MATKNERLHRPWAPPKGYAEAQASRPSGVMLYNSLVDEKKLLVPAAGLDSRHLTWYSCGPTVYDSAHLGHSRNYVTFDILRRLLQDYFGYNVHTVMNVTDVEDKIIVRARRKHLLQQYRKERPPLKEVTAQNTVVEVDRAESGLIVVKSEAVPSYMLGRSSNFPRGFHHP